MLSSHWVSVFLSSKINGGCGERMYLQLTWPLPNSWTLLCGRSKTDSTWPPRRAHLWMKWNYLLQLKQPAKHSTYVSLSEITRATTNLFLYGDRPTTRYNHWLRAEHERSSRCGSWKLHQEHKVNVNSAIDKWMSFRFCLLLVAR